MDWRDEDFICERREQELLKRHDYLQKRFDEEIVEKFSVLMEESENAARKAIALAEKVKPCVIWIDEKEEKK